VALSRITGIQAKLRELEADAFFSFNRFDNEYLTGFRGSTSVLLITPTQALLLCDFRYMEQARAQAEGCEIHEVVGSMETRLGERLGELGIERAVFEPAVLTVQQLHTVQAAFSGRLSAAEGLCRTLREDKDAAEITRIREASALAEGVLQDLIPELKAGVREQTFAAQLEFEFKQRGASGPSFEPIVLFGSRSSLPHGVPGDRALRAGDIVLVDMGCVHASYCSDLTRTFVFGTIPGAWFEEIYDVTLRAQLAALEAVQPGASCREVDAVAREIIREAGYGNRFGHGLGHGVGLEVHESPRLNVQSEAVLRPGMVVTVEPGIYLPGQGGVRIEDLVAVTETGHEVLTHSPKELKVLTA